MRRCEGTHAVRGVPVVLIAAAGTPASSVICRRFDLGKDEVAVTAAMGLSPWRPPEARTGGLDLLREPRRSGSIDTMSARSTHDMENQDWQQIVESLRRR